MMGIFEQLSWLTTRVKRLCCAVDKIKESGAGSYKVYTALVSQTGGSNVIHMSSGDLAIGVTYRIEEGIEEGDFTNVGAPNNAVGTYFVATGTTPNSWGINEGTTSILSYNLGAPTVAVLQNTLGNIYFVYNSVGDYSLHSSERLFLDNSKVFILTNTRTEKFLNGEFHAMYDDSTVISLYSVASFAIPDQYTDGVLQLCSLEIRVYN